MPALKSGLHPSLSKARVSALKAGRAVCLHQGRVHVSVLRSRAGVVCWATRTEQRAVVYYLLSLGTISQDTFQFAP